jgi:hypothetical protein
LLGAIEIFDAREQAPCFRVTRGSLAHIKVRAPKGFQASLALCGPLVTQPGDRPIRLQVILGLPSHAVRVTRSGRGLKD